MAQPFLACVVKIWYLDRKDNRKEYLHNSGLEDILSAAPIDSTLSAVDLKNYYTQYNITRNDVLSNYAVTTEVPFIGIVGNSEILGRYVPSEDRVYVVQGLDPHTKTYVKHHEWEHRRRAYSGESQDEQLVDHAVEQKLGYGINRYG